MSRGWLERALDPSPPKPAPSTRPASAEHGVPVARSQVLPIRETDPSQDTDALRRVVDEVARLLTPNEELLYVALQNATALSMKKDCAVVTSNRLILYRPGLFGAANFDDWLWQDVKDVTIKQGMLSTEVTVEGVSGGRSVIGGLDKHQARRLYGLAQQLEQEWREKRRIRQMEEARAQAGGIYLANPPAAPTIGPSAPLASAPETGAPAGAVLDDSVARLARAKTMRDQGLISDAEFETVKAKILAEL